MFVMRVLYKNVDETGIRCICFCLLTICILKATILRLIKCLLT